MLRYFWAELEEIQRDIWDVIHFQLNLKNFLLIAFGNNTRLFSVIGEDNLSKMAVKQILDERKVDIDESLLTIQNATASKVIVLYGF